MKGCQWNMVVVEVSAQGNVIVEMKVGEHFPYLFHPEATGLFYDFP